jgi:hypothetical protein
MLHALSKPAFWLAAALASAPLATRAQQTCQAVASELRSGKSAIDPSPERKLDPNQAIDVLQGEFRASPGLMEAVAKKLLPDSVSVSLYRFGDTASWGAKVLDSGTAHCEYFAFFIRASDGTSKIFDEPPVLRDARERETLATCFDGSATIGEAGGGPAFILQNGQDQDKTITITPWRDGAWQKTCTVAAHYDAIFTVTNRYCQGIDCAKVSEFGRRLAVQTDKDPNALPPVPFHRELAGPAELPTFGKGPRDPWTFAEEAPATIVQIDGKSYFARLGHAAIGWRRFPDYLFALYRETGGDDLEPVAGIVIAKKRDKPASITVK